MLSAKVGMSPQHLSEIESGKRDPRLSSIERMAEAMGMPEPPQRMTGVI
jgi:transcriptional regulator with XRE-family HTH domain